MEKGLTISNLLSSERKVSTEIRPRRDIQDGSGEGLEERSKREEGVSSRIPSFLTPPVSPASSQFPSPPPTSIHVHV